MSKPRTKYEYEVHSWNDDIGEFTFDLKEYLNKQGKKGWQLISRTEDRGFYHFIFMRVKQ